MDEIKNEGAPASNIAPGTEGATHTGAIEPHSEAANALPNGGASGVSNEGIAQAVQQTIHTNEPNVHETGIPMTAERISVDENPLPKGQHPNDVKFKVKYAKDFKGEKTLPEGSVQVISKESADKFTKLGFGSIIK